nr:unnamed protein product [Callosobruchus chinensis]
MLNLYLIVVECRLYHFEIPSNRELHVRDMEIWSPCKDITENVKSKNYGILVLNVPIEFECSHEFVTSLWNQAKVRMTVDGGTQRWLDWLKMNNYDLDDVRMPELFSGDMDSTPEATLNFFKHTCTQVIYTPNQNETDFVKALRKLQTYCEGKCIKTLVNKAENTCQDIEDLKQKYRLLERRSRKNNVVVFGLRNIENTEDSLLTVLNKLNSVLDTNIEVSDLNDFYSLGKADNSPFVLEFISNIRKRALFKNPDKLKKLKGKGLAIANDLCPDDRSAQKVLLKHLKSARLQNLNASIKGFKLIINGEEYLAEDLMQIEKETAGEDSDSGSEVESVGGRHEKKETPRKAGQPATSSTFRQQLVESRLDQIIANINALYKSKQIIGSCRLFLLAKNSLTWLLDAGKHSISIPQPLRDNQKWCALLPIGEPCQISTTGLKWNLDQQKLKFGNLVSTSNSYSGSEIVTVETDNPVVWSMSIDNLL